MRQQDGGRRGSDRGRSGKQGDKGKGSFKGKNFGESGKGKSFGGSAKGKTFGSKGKASGGTQGKSFGGQGGGKGKGSVSGAGSGSSSRSSRSTGNEKFNEYGKRRDGDKPAGRTGAVREFGDSPRAGRSGNYGAPKGQGVPKGTGAPRTSGGAKSYGGFKSTGGSKESRDYKGSGASRASGDSKPYGGSKGNGGGYKGSGSSKGNKNFGASEESRGFKGSRGPKTAGSSNKPGGYRGPKTSGFSEKSRDFKTSRSSKPFRGGDRKPQSDSDLPPGTEIAELTIKRLGINGEGVGYFRKKTVFVKGALPRETVAVRVTREAMNYVEAELIKIIEASPDRVKPPCPIYEECGGCQLQHLSYPAQLTEKTEIVAETFRRYVSHYSPETGDPDALPLRPMIGMDNPWGYRNKAQLQVGLSDGRVIAGLYEMGSHDLVDLSDCMVQHPVLNEMVRETRGVIEELRIPIYDERKRSGVLRTIVARTGFATGECQLVLVTATDDIPRKKELIMELRYRLPNVKSIVQNVNPMKTSLVFGDKTRVLWGAEMIREQLGDIQFMLSPRSFFQLNPEQTEKLYRLVEEAADLQGNEMVVDAYSGVGTIALWLSRRVREVRGIEVIPEAVEDARRNAKLNGMANVSFYEGKAEELLPHWAENSFFKPDVVVADPPRTGMDRMLLEALLQVKPERLVYVSCNPSTLAKDCDVLLKGGYKLEWIQPVDMFPQTSRIECVARMCRE